MGVLEEGEGEQRGRFEEPLPATPRDKYGVSLLIRDPKARERGQFASQDEDMILWQMRGTPIEQDRICMMFGYCPIHQCIHAPSSGKRRKVRSGR
jgi:hypothetical protein